MLSPRVELGRPKARRFELRVYPVSPREHSANAESRTRNAEAAVLSRVCLPFHHVGMVLRRGVEPPRPCGHCGLNAARLPFRHLRMSAASGTRTRSFSGLNRARFPVSPPQRSCATPGSNRATTACRAVGFTSFLVAHSWTTEDLNLSQSPYQSDQGKPARRGPNLRPPPRSRTELTDL